MAHSSQTPWSNDPNAPQLPTWLHLIEKAFLAGFFIGAISYGALTPPPGNLCSPRRFNPIFLGIVVALFFECMRVLLSPSNTIKRSVKWALIVHTLALFLVLTVAFGIDASHLFLGFIGNRQSPGNDYFPPGPLGYDDLLGFTAATTVFDATWPLNQWLDDGLLVGLVLNSVA